MKRKQPWKLPPSIKWTVTGNMFAAPTLNSAWYVTRACEIDLAVTALLKNGFERITIVVSPQAGGQ